MLEITQEERQLTEIVLESTMPSDDNNDDELKRGNSPIRTVFSSKPLGLPSLAWHSATSACPQATNAEDPASSTSIEAVPRSRSFSSGECSKAVLEMGLLRTLCCCSDRKASPEDLESGYARIVEFKAAEQPTHRVSLPSQRSRPSNDTREQPSELTAPLIDIDEKHSYEAEETDCSSRSSVISTPSTNIRSLTESHTGDSDGSRNSYASEPSGPPPSYKSECVPSPLLDLGIDEEHPVMRRDWLARLQEQANEDASHIHGRETSPSELAGASPGAVLFHLHPGLPHARPLLYHDLDDLLDFEEWRNSVQG